MTDTTASPSTTAPLTWEEVVAGCREVGDGAYLSTVGADGRPHVAWVSLGYTDEKIWFSTFRSSQKGVNLRTTPEVALAWPESPERLVFGRATQRLVDVGPESDELWDAGILSYDPALFFGTKDNPELLFVELTPTRIAIGSLIAPDDPPRVWTPSR